MDRARVFTVPSGPVRASLMARTLVDGDAASVLCVDVALTLVLGDLDVLVAEGLGD
jgi:hypothetical protein